MDVKGLSFGYGEKTIIQSIDLNLEYGKLVCIIGPNGVGKSTLVKCLNRVLEPDEGIVTIDEEEISRMRLIEIARRIGYVPVASNEVFRMNVLEAVLLGRHPHQKPGSRSVDIEIAYEALEMVDMQDYAMNGTDELSAGQKQRVAIAKGLAQMPKILILDEPTANLDPKHQIKVTKLLKKVTRDRGISVIMVSHDLNIASRFADSIVVMAPPGIIRAIGSPEDVITKEIIDSVYDLDCEVIRFDGRPHVILRDA